MIPSGQLVASEFLATANNILFVGNFSPTHLVYLNQLLRALAVAYPSINIYLFTTYRASQSWLPWQQPRRDVVKDWCGGLPILTKVYRIDDHNQIRKDAQQHPFDLVISLADEHQPYFARLARTWAGKSPVVATQQLLRWYRFYARRSFARCGRLFEMGTQALPWNIRYHTMFEQLFGSSLASARDLPRIQLPKQWVTYGKLLFLKWGIDKRSKQFSRVVFISPYADDDRAGLSLSLPQILALITQLGRADEYGDISFIINVPEHRLKKARAFFAKQSVNNAHLFCANTNFFQLPAVMGLCDVTVAVQSLNLHLAYALSVPTLGVDITANNSSSHPVLALNGITTDDMVAQVKRLWAVPLTPTEALVRENLTL